MVGRGYQLVWWLVPLKASRWEILLDLELSADQLEIWLGLETAQQTELSLDLEKELSWVP